MVNFLDQFTLAAHYSSGQVVVASDKFRGAVHYKVRPDLKRVLVDRGGREVPVRPTYVGKNLPVATSEWVEIELGAGPDGGGIFLVPRS